MAGTYQHYLQQMIQKGFKCAESGKRHPSVWIYSKNTSPDRIRIEKFGGEDEFYSPLSNGKAATLDDKISYWESHRQADLRKWRKLPDGTSVDASKAAEIVGLTGVRTKTIRTSMQTVLESIVPEFASVLRDPDVLMSRIENFDRLDEYLESAIISELGTLHKDIPKLKASLEFKAVMRMLRYAVSEVMGYKLADALRDVDLIFAQVFETGKLDIPTLHNEALESLFDDGIAREDMLSLNWSVRENSSSIPWILSDCAVLNIDQFGHITPFLFASKKDQNSVILPLSPSKALVGVPKDFDTPDLQNLTSASAACSEDFFIANQKCEQLEDLIKGIGSNHLGEVKKSAEIALSGIDPLRNCREPAEIPILKSFTVSAHSIELSEEELQQVGQRMSVIIGRATSDYDLIRLEKIVITRNIAAALAEKRDTEETAFSEDDPNNFVYLSEEGDGDLNYTIYLQWGAVQVLCMPESESFDFVYELYVQTLSQIHIRSVLASASDGLDTQTFTNPDIGTWARDVSMMGACKFMDAVHGLRITDPGDDAFHLMQERMIHALEAFIDQAVPREGNEEQRNLVARAFSNATELFFFETCRYLGFCQELKRPASDLENLSRLLKTNGLVEWLARLDFDLQRLKITFAAPLEPDRVIALQGHLERLFWARGTVCISEGGGYVLPFEDETLTYVSLRENVRVLLTELLPSDTSELVNSVISEM